MSQAASDRCRTCSGYGKIKHQNGNVLECPICDGIGKHVDATDFSASPKTNPCSLCTPSLCLCSKAKG